ncbi:MAG TPA: hypothetical protein VNA20_07575 [Frankiaceae bacterium]|nr:hypothetical protein [Frankiaceae bacterium]
MNDTVRDPQVAAALEGLDVPDHAPDFWTDLTARLHAEEAAAPAEAPEAPAERGDGVVVPLASRRSAFRRHALRLTTVAAAVAVLAVALGGGLGTENGPLAPRPATAAEVASRVNAAFAEARTLRGTLVFRDAAGPGDRTTFIATASGDLRLETTTARGEVNVIAYDATRGVEEGYWLPGPAAASPPSAGVRTGLAPVQTPDQGPMAWVLRTSLAATLRAGSTGPAPEVTYEGRPAWLLEADAQPQDSAGDQAIDHIAATIDRETALPVRVVESRNGRTIREITIEGLTTGGEADRAAFDLDLPAGVTVSRTDEGFRRVPLTEVEARAGYAPLVPRTLPEGFELAEVAVAKRGGHTGPEGLNPDSRDVVSLAYRRGFATVLVTTRRQLPGEWYDPMGSGEGIVDRPERVTLGGALAGAERAELVVNAQGTAPHVWALTGTLVVTVSGDLSRAELLDVAGSLAA